MFPPIKKCKGCEERSEKMKAAAQTIIDWMKNPTFGGRPPVEVFEKLASESNKAKKESSGD